MIIDEIIRVYERGGPPGPVGSMFPGALAQPGAASSLSAGAAPSFIPPASSGPPPGMPMPPQGMPMPPPMPAPNQSLGLPPLEMPPAQTAPPADGPKINPQRAAALGLR